MSYRLSTIFLSMDTDRRLNYQSPALVILEHAGKDATERYAEVHSLSLLSNTLDSANLVGLLDTSTIDRESTPMPSKKSKIQLQHEKPPLCSLLSSHDFEAVAARSLKPKAWAFYSSAATDLITMKANKSFFDRIWFRPRVLRNVRNVDTSCLIQGVESSLPLFVAPAALARMVHPSGEKGIAAACATRGVIQCISTNASYSATEILSSAPSTYPFFFQLYVHKKRSDTSALLSTISSHHPNVTSIFLTVDAPCAGKREADERVKADESMQSPMTGVTAVNDKFGGSLGRIMGSFIDETLSWEDLSWLRSIWKGKIVIKGIMSAEDAIRAAAEGCDGIVISNHGGRNLDTSPPPILTLLELQLRCPEVFEQLQVFVDGGIRRGTDILKCLCLGARAVLVGRPILYALNYGQEGVEQLLDIFKNELEVAMRLVGITDLSQVHPALVNTADIDHLVPRTEGHPYAKWPSGSSKMSAKL